MKKIKIKFGFRRCSISDGFEVFEESCTLSSFGNTVLDITNLLYVVVGFWSIKNNELLRAGDHNPFEGVTKPGS